MLTHPKSTNHELAHLITKFGNLRKLIVRKLNNEDRILRNFLDSFEVWLIQLIPLLNQLEYPVVLDQISFIDEINNACQINLNCNAKDSEEYSEFSREQIDLLMQLTESVRVSKITLSKDLLQPLIYLQFCYCRNVTAKLFSLKLNQPFMQELQRLIHQILYIIYSYLFEGNIYFSAASNHKIDNCPVIAG